MSEVNDYSGLARIGAIRKLQSKDLAIKAQANIIEQLEKQRDELAEAICKIHGKVSPYVGCLDAVEENGGEDSEEVLESVFHIAYYASFIAKHNGE
jgi:hypothetical protein|tara:strand:- start:226 stop:513 length:288 start_codon:yes stop_codon:yes gene_type:complete